MPAERPAGSNSGRAKIDWHKAFLFYASLPAELRDYQAVAEKFEVSVRTVERHGREDSWKQQARELDRESVRVAAERLRDARAEKLVDTDKIVDASLVTYAKQLIAGEVKLNPNHVVKLYELRERNWKRQDEESVDQAEQAAEAADPIDPTERKLQVLRAMEEAGVLARLLHPDRETDDTDLRAVRGHPNGADGGAERAA